MENTATIEIECPIDQVFRLTSEHVAEWSAVVIEDDVIDEKPEGVGTTFRTLTEDHGKQMEFQGVVTRFEKPHLHAVEMTGDSFDIESEFTFEKLSENRTKVTQRADVTGKGFFKIMFFCCGWLMKKSQCDASAKELERLKEFCVSHREADGE